LRRASLLAVAALGLVIAPSAGAHAEITPEKVPASGVSTFVVNVEGELDSPTIRVAVQVPAGLAQVKTPVVPGWQVTRAGRVITWSGGSFGHEEYGKFKITARFPNTPGSRLKFPTVQTYGNGAVVRWIGAESSDTPAPTILLTAAAQPPPPPPPPPPPAIATTTTASVNDEDDWSTGWLVGAVVGAVLVGSAVALLWRRRR
jgi:uncharacterized protein YcnI